MDSSVQRNNTISKNHRFTLNNRKTLMLTGISGTKTFDEEEVILHSLMGDIKITGKELHLTKLDLESNEASVEGTINGIVYLEKKIKRTKRFFI